jgi:nucleoporin GLE1
LADIQRLQEQNAHQMEEVRSQLEGLRLKQQEDEKRLRKEWKDRDRKLWERIEGVISFEEEKVRKRMEQEQRLKEDAERKRKEEEERRKEEQRRKEEEQRLKKELQEAKRKKEEQEAAEQKVIEEREKQVQEQREKLAMTTVGQDWQQARKDLKVGKV